MTGIISQANKFTGDVLETLLTEGVLVREQTGGRISKKRISIFPNWTQVFCLLIFIVEVFGISSDGAELLAVAAESLRTVGVLPSTTESKALHHRVYLGFKYLGQLKLKANK